MKYMEVQNYPETKIQCYATYVMQQSPVGSKEVPFINGFNSGSFSKWILLSRAITMGLFHTWSHIISIWKRIWVLELFIPYIQKDVLNADSGLDLQKLWRLILKIFTTKNVRFVFSVVIWFWWGSTWGCPVGAVMKRWSSEDAPHFTIFDNRIDSV